MDAVFTTGRHENLVFNYINQSYFGLPRQSVRTNSDKIILFKQTLRDVESVYKDVGWYDIAYCEFEGMWCNAWSERFKYLCIDMTIKK